MPETVPKCRYPDPDEFPEECEHYYVDGAGRCRRDGMPCEVFDQGKDDESGKPVLDAGKPVSDAGDEEKTAE